MTRPLHDAAIPKADRRADQVEEFGSLPQGARVIPSVEHQDDCGFFADVGCDCQLEIVFLQAPSLGRGMMLSPSSLPAEWRVLAKLFPEPTDGNRYRASTALSELVQKSTHALGAGLLDADAKEDPR